MRDAGVIPTITAPAASAFVTTRTPTITWSEFGSADEIEVAQTLTGTPTATGISTGSYTTAALAISDSPYYARVRQSGGEWSESVAFYVSLLAAGTMFLWLQGGFEMYQDTAGTIPAAVTGDPIGKWGDRSGQANHALQSGDSGLKPRVLESAINSKSALKFDGIDDFLSIANANSLKPNNLQLYIVCEIPSGTGGFRVLSKGAAGYRGPSREAVNTNLRWDMANSSDVQITSPTTGAVITRVKYNRTRIAFKITGKNEVTAAHTTAISGTDPLTLSAITFDKWIYLVAGYSAELGAAEQAAVESYLTALTGLSV